MYGKPRPAYLWALLILLLACTVLGAAPLFWKMSGTPFLPSQSWAQTSAVWQALGGIGLAALFMITMAASRPWRNPNLPKHNTAVAFVAGPVVAIWLGKTAVLAGGPMIGALVADRPMALPYRVAYAHGWGDGKCRNPIVLQDLPIMFNRLCHYSEDFRKTLQKNTNITVKGRGTNYGLFPAKVTRQDR